MSITSVVISHIRNILPLLITHGPHHGTIKVTLPNRLLIINCEDSRDNDSKGEHDNCIVEQFHNLQQGNIEELSRQSLTYIESNKGDL